MITNSNNKKIENKGNALRAPRVAMQCKKSKNGMHNFPVAGGDCANACGVNQNELSGRKLRKLEPL